MAILKNKKTDRREGDYRLMVATATALLVALAFFTWRQIRLERYMYREPEKQETRAMAILEKTEGEVLARRTNALDYRRVTTGAVFESGDFLQTVRNSSAVLLFGDSTRIGLSADSLLVISGAQGAGHASVEGPVLRIEKGEISIDSEDSGGEIAALLTPTALIRLNVRETGIYSPEEYMGMLPPGAGGDNASRHGYAYLMYLKTSYVPAVPPEDAAPELMEIYPLLERAEAACAETFGSEECATAQDAAWQKIIGARALLRGRRRVAVTASVDEDGNEDIRVDEGMVRVETKTRTLAVARGEGLKIQPGKTIDRPDASASAVEAMTGEPAALTPVEVEVFYWE